MADKYELVYSKEIHTNETNKVVVALSKKVGNGEHRIDIRHYFLPTGSTVWSPTKKGVNLKVEEIDNLLEGLQGAKKLLPQTVSTP